MRRRIVMQQFLGFTGNRTYTKNIYADGSISYTESMLQADGSIMARLLDDLPYIATPMPGDPVYLQDMENTK